MEFNKLRLLGFKSFVEPTEFVIEKGLPVKSPTLGFLTTFIHK